MLSSQARYWLAFFSQNPVRINYRTLMEHGVSRRKSMEIMRELKQAGKLRARKSRGNGTKLELTTVVGSVSPVLQNSSTASSTISNSSTASTTNSATNKFLVVNEEEGKSMGWDFFSPTSSNDDDDVIQNRKKHEEHKKKIYQEAQEAKAAKRRDLHRSKVDPTLWSCKDVAYEFADRLRDLWDIKPFSVTQSRFVPALAQFRKKHDTNGALELELINLFFSSLQGGKYTDGNHLWRAFLYKAPALLQTARENVVTPEQVETAIIRDSEYASKKLSMFDEDDDVQP